MSCRSCSSNRQSVFPTELNIHFAGREGLEKPTVWVFPQLLVCLDCGFTSFVVPESQLLKLNEGCSQDRERGAAA